MAVEPIGEGSRIRIVVADDDSIVREALAELIEMEPAMELVGLAANGEEALALVESTRPDVLVLDVKMPGVDGLATTRALSERYPGVAVVVLSAYEDAATVDEMLAAGALDYVVKGATGDRLLGAIQSCAGRAMAERVADRPPSRPAPRSSSRSMLSAWTAPPSPAGSPGPSGSSRPPSS